MRPIDADALKVTTKWYCDVICQQDLCEGCELKYIEDLIDDEPPLDVAPVVHARWIPNSPFTGNCSECGSDGNLKDNYCPNCGAAIDGGTK